MRSLIYIIGGMCTGKSTLAKEFEKKGAHFIDLDFYGRKVASGLKDFSNSDELLEYMSTSRENLLRINNVIHPKVYDMLLEDMPECGTIVVEYSGYSASQGRNDDLFLKDADFVIATSVPYDVRKEWAEKRLLDLKRFEKLVCLQPTQGDYEGVADLIFENGEVSREVRDERIERLWLACSKRI